MDRDFLHTLSRRVLVFDGAMGTSVQARDLSAEDFGGHEGFNDGLVLHNPTVIEEIHASFLEAGCDVLETDTFGGTRLKLDEYGHGDRTVEQNEAAARIARSVADRFETSSRPRFVAGSMGPTGLLPSTEDPDLGNVAFSDLVEVYREQAVGLARGGCDVLILETCQDILEMKAQIFGSRSAFEETGRRLPLICQVTLDPTGRMLLGTDVAAAMVTLEALGADVIGLNCSTGPLEMKDSIRFLGSRCSRPVSCIPNAGLPRNVGGRAVYDLDPDAFAAAMREFVADLGVSVVGGCCGTTPEHIRCLVEEVSDLSPRRDTPPRWHALSSGMTATALAQEPRPALVGERINAQGSRRAKRLILADDLDGLADLGRSQVEAGAHLLDVCVALTERGGEDVTMSALVRRLSLTAPAPLSFDTTEPDVVRAALEACPGRPLVNSVNLEGGEAKTRTVLPEVARHGAAVVALVIDEEGMAKTAERKLSVARRLHGIVTGEFGLPAEGLLIDALTFTLATGEDEWRRSAVETLEGIRRIKESLPGVLTVLGVSNVSFGLTAPARRVLNSVFLTHAVRAGLDAAIVNAAELTPFPELDPGDREAAEDLVLDRREDALARFVARFEGREVDDAGTASDPEEGLSVEERIRHRILQRKPEGIEDLLDRALESRSPVDVLNTVLLEAMREVGDRFGRGELILPFVLQSAEVMKRAVSHVERFLDKDDAVTKGTVVLATVFGDVHDIGKNLVRTILQNNGYTVHDLGKQVPVRTILESVDETGADAVGLSALLVSTSRQMPIVVEELHARGSAIPVLIGGAAINPAFARRTLFVGDDAPYAGGVFYCRDAFAGLETLDRLGDPERRGEVVAENFERARRGLAATAGREAPAPVPAGAGRSLAPAPTIPEPPFTGARTFEDIDLREVFPLLDRKSLFTLSWGVRGKKIDREKLLTEEFEPLLEELQEEAIREGWLRPVAVRGYFTCRAMGDAIVVLDDDGRERARFDFPRQPSAPHLCLADHVLEERDVLGLQVVTVGDRVSELTERWSEEGSYTRAYLLHGLAVETAEAVAEWCHGRVRSELGLPAECGKRYSPGYPACPDLSQHRAIFDLLGAREAIGVDLTEAHQIVPEQSTAAFVLHHPEATYYTMASRRAGARGRPA